MIRTHPRKAALLISHQLDHFDSSGLILSRQGRIPLETQEGINLWKEAKTAL
jgi:hypothetical protein